MQILLNIVYECSGKCTNTNEGNVNKESWFGSTNLKATKEVFQQLKIFRKTDSVTIKDQYIEANKHYKQLCAKKRRKYWQDCVNEMKVVNNANDFWKIARCFKSKKFVTDSKHRFDMVV